MLQESFADGNSFIHRLDPRVKLVIAIAYAFVVGFSSQLALLGGALVLAVGCVIQAQLLRKAFFKKLLHLNKLLILCWLIIPWTFEGKPIADTFPIPITEEGLLFCSQLTLRLNAMVMMFTALVTTESIVNIGHALNDLKVPGKIVHLLFITYRYVFLIEQEYLRLHNTLKARGFSPKPNFHTYRTFAYLLGMLLVRSAERAERVHQAMVCRGFHGKFYSLSSFSLTLKDYLWGSGMILVLLLIGLMEWNIQM